MLVYEDMFKICKVISSAENKKYLCTMCWQHFTAYRHSSGNMVDFLLEISGKGMCHPLQTLFERSFVFAYHQLLCGAARPQRNLEYEVPHVHLRTGLCLRMRQNMQDSFTGIYCCYSAFVSARLLLGLFGSLSWCEIYLGEK